MKIIAASIQYQAMRHGDQRALLKVVNDALSAGRPITSASGATAALAINWCEARELPWKCVAVPGPDLRYHFERLPNAARKVRQGREQEPASRDTRLEREERADVALDKERP